MNRIQNNCEWVLCPYVLIDRLAVVTALDNTVCIQNMCLCLHRDRLAVVVAWITIDSMVCVYVVMETG